MAAAAPLPALPRLPSRLPQGGLVMQDGPLLAFLWFLLALAFVANGGR
jgi:hypothetical protein